MNAIKQKLTSKNRIVDLDIIRGFALIGIFLVNIAEFSQRAGAGQLSDVNWINILATGKFLCYLLFTFGAGSALFLSRAKAKGQPYSLYIRRMIILAVIGLLHASIWSGDVLVPYAIVGLVLLSLHKNSW